MRETLNRSLLTEAKWTGKRLNIFLIKKNFTAFSFFYKKVKFSEIEIFE